MRILIATASKHGSTAEIGEQLGRAITSGLRARNIEPQVDVKKAHDVHTVDGYDAVVLGSAIYLGKWLKDATRLVDRDLDALQKRPVWLFSSGPITPGDNADNLKWINTPWAVEHHMFGGKLDPSVLSFTERIATRAAKATEGDFRSPDDIAAWADSICSTLAAHPDR
ncbi:MULTISPECIES: flavodoxin domain-containing protein [Rhodococcus]|uniref:flavodoxin domain-containing protein n=1 Tax=Rhodococcus globerulus TaxID=33008 RepID=UPI001C59BC55|nr:flavodoxin domain-containing protein [Rhodococcus globerulus]QXW02985.1 flavodoxin domain-containing protein [Rhodococcus globerulus]